MRQLNLILFFLFQVLISFNSVAGLFCDEPEKFECNLYTRIYSDRIAYSKIEKKTFLISADTVMNEELDNWENVVNLRYKSNTQDVSAEKLGYDTHNAYKIGDTDSVRVHDCSATTVIDNKERVTTGWWKVTGHVDLTCSVDHLEKKTENEIKKEQCFKAITCASKVNDTAKLKAYLALRKGLCGSDSESSTSITDVNSTSRSKNKENDMTPSSSVNVSGSISK